MGLPTRTHSVAALITLLALVCGPCFGVTKIAVFPLVNKSQDKSLDWLASLVPEYFARHIPLCADLQVIDPTFLFSIDSTGWTMGSDSLLRTNWVRWGWNSACGGAFTVSNGRIFCEIRAVVLRNNKPVKKVFTENASMDSLSQACFSFFSQFVSLIGGNLTKEQYQEFKRPLSLNPQAYATFLAGYGYEMRNNTAAAITSYARAAELDPSMAPAWSRMASLFRTTGAFDKARQLFDRSLAAAGNDPAVIAAAADFMVEHDPPAKVYEFVKKNQQVLELTSDGMVAMGKSFLSGGESQRAIAMLTRAVARGPSDLSADFVLGKAYMAAGQFQQACDVFNRLVRYRPDYARFYALLGAAYRNSGHLMESLRVLERSAVNSPNDIPVLVNLAQTYIDLDLFQEAHQVLLHAQDLAPDIPDIYVNLGVLAWRTGKTDDAKRLLEKAAHMGTNVQSALNNEANILYINGNIRRALDVYKKADKAGAKNESVLSNLANAYLALNRLDEAAAALESVLSMSPERLDILGELASLAERRNRPSDAITYYRKILELSPHNVDALVRMATLMTKVGQFKEAVDPLDAYCSDYPNEKKVLLLQADVYRRMGWYEVALMKYQAIIRDFAGDAEGFVGMGRTMYDLFQYKNGTDYDNAISFLRTAVELNPSDPEPEYLVGLIYMNYKRNPDLAREQWRTALSKATDPDMKKMLADLLEKAGK
jgi:tetratricopeptide (TPR) repeat protein